MKSRYMVLALIDINTTSGTQMRVLTPQTTVLRYARDMDEGVKFPRIVVVFDGTNYYLVDGFCRYEAAKHNHYTTIEAVVFIGTLDDALRMAFGANASHGEPRTDADKENTVRAACLKYTDRAHTVVAEICAVSTEYVRQQREVHGYPVAVKLIGKNGVPQAARKKKKQPVTALTATSSQVAILQPKAPAGPGAAEPSSAGALKNPALLTDADPCAKFDAIVDPVAHVESATTAFRSLVGHDDIGAHKVSDLGSLHATLLEVALRVAERLTCDATTLSRLAETIESDGDLDAADWSRIDEMRTRVDVLAQLTALKDSWQTAIASL